MKTGAICVAITFAVLLALPKTTGAPSSGCDSNKSDDVISEKISKQASQSSQRALKEERESSSTHAQASNGMFSGSKSLSETTEVTEADQEQSRIASEKRTATGSEKVEKEQKKKKVVEATQKKSVVIYYMVSYKRLPDRGDTETKEEYYKRIFPKEDNLQVFYHKLFKSYEEEDPKAYMSRIEFIFDNIYPELDVRLDKKWLTFFDHYYTIKYCRKVDEPDEHYYARVLEKLNGESCEHYKNRMACLVASLDEEDFSHITFDDSAIGYKVGKRKQPAKSVSSPNSSGIKQGKFQSTSKRSKKEEENVSQSESSVQHKSQKGSSSDYQKKRKSTKETLETEEDTECFAYKVAYTKLPKKTVGQKDEDYYKAFFGPYNCKMSTDERNELYLRILIQYKGENMTEYWQRIDFLFDKVYPQLDIRTNKTLLTLLEHYYKEKYAIAAGECEDAWFERVLKRQKRESKQHYRDRLACIRTCIPKPNWSRVLITWKPSKWFTLKPASS